MFRSLVSRITPLVTRSISRASTRSIAIRSTLLRPQLVLRASSSIRFSSDSTAVVPAVPEQTNFGDEPFRGSSQKRVSKEAEDILLAPIDPALVEIKPDGLLYLPEIRYRKILHRAFGPGGWALEPRGDAQLQGNTVSREFALFVNGAFVSQARGEQDYFASNPNMSYATAVEAAKSNAMVRCCKDLGIANELWDPSFISRFKREHCIQVFVETKDGKKKTLWRKKDAEPFTFPYTETGVVGGGSAPSKPEPVRATRPLPVAPQEFSQDDIPFEEELPTPPPRASVKAPAATVKVPAQVKTVSPAKASTSAATGKKATPIAATTNPNTLTSKKSEESAAPAPKESPEVTPSTNFKPDSIAAKSGQLKDKTWTEAMSNSKDRGYVKWLSEKSTNATLKANALAALLHFKE